MLQFPFLLPLPFLLLLFLLPLLLLSLLLLFDAVYGVPSLQGAHISSVYYLGNSCCKVLGERPTSEDSVSRSLSPGSTYDHAD
jgi:hypothetical protein